LAGKFVPGMFTKEHPLIQDKWNTGLIHHSVSLPMAVLRLPLRNYYS